MYSTLMTLLLYDVYLIETESGDFYIQKTMHIYDVDGEYVQFLTPELIAGNHVDGYEQSVILDQNGVPAVCTIISWTDTEIHCTTTAHFAGPVGISINNGPNHSAYLANGFTYVGAYIPDAPNTGSTEMSDFIKESPYVLSVATMVLVIGALLGKRFVKFGAKNSGYFKI